MLTRLRSQVSLGKTLSQKKNTEPKSLKSAQQDTHPNIYPGDLIYVAGEISTFNDMYGMRHHHIIANPILALVIKVIENFAVLYINEQPHLEKFSYASVKLDSDVLKIAKLT